MGQITGWGQTTHVNGHRADVLQVAYTPLVDIQTCRQQWGITRITERMQCVGGNGVNSGCKVYHINMYVMSQKNLLSSHQPLPFLSLTFQG